MNVRKPSKARKSRVGRDYTKQRRTWVASVTPEQVLAWARTEQDAKLDALKSKRKKKAV